MTTEYTPLWLTADYWQGRFVSNDTPWELGHPSAVLLEGAEELENRGVSIRDTRILSPGCGRGSDALAFVERGAHVVAMDWSDVAIADIRARYERLSDMKGSLEVESGDFFAIDARHVEVVIEHTFFCAIDPTARQQYVDRVSTWLVPGGYLVGNFFILSEEEAQALSGLSLTQAGEGPPFATTVTELLRLLDTRYETVLLRPSSRSEPGRRPGMEWLGIFRKR